MATLYQREGKYYLNYSVNGKRIRKSVGTDKKKANIFLEELRYKLFRGDIKPNKPEIPIEFFFNRYLKSCKARLTNGTYIRYQNAIKHFTKFFTSHCPVQFIDQINKGMIQEYILFRQQTDSRPKAKTINIELTTLRSSMTWAVDNEMISINPCHKMKLLKTTDSKKGQSLSEEEVNALLRGCNTLKDGSWFKQILITFINTGMRRGELVNLTWDDVDLEEGIIKIQDKPFWSPKTYQRVIPINETVKDLLMSLKMASQGIFVFGHDGEKILDNRLRKKLITLSRRVGLPHITRIHDFRHTFASNLLMKGVDIPTVQALLGHQSWNTTLIYSHQTKEHTKKAVRVLD